MICMQGMLAPVSEEAFASVVVRAVSAFGAGAQGVEKGSDYPSLIVSPPGRPGLCQYPILRDALPLLFPRSQLMDSHTYLRYFRPP
jgi:hypothetical protein